MSKIKAIACPVCKKTVHAESRPPTFPFCSVTCKNIDLGRWLDQRYAVDVESGRLGLVEHEEGDDDDTDPTVH